MILALLESGVHMGLPDVLAEVRSDRVHEGEDGLDIPKDDEVIGFSSTSTTL